METANDERTALADSLCSPFRNNGAPFAVSAFSYPAGKVVDLAVDWNYSTGTDPNWRERLLCPVTGLNTRLRATIHLVDSQLDLYQDSAVYVTEQITRLLNHLLQRFPSLAGSEYISAETPRGSIVARGVRDEDLTQLSFPSASFEGVMSLGYFEHIPDFSTALRECLRILKPGGCLLFTVPFATNAHAHFDSCPAQARRQVRASGRARLSRRSDVVGRMPLLHPFRVAAHRRLERVRLRGRQSDRALFPRVWLSGDRTPVLLRSRARGRPQPNLDLRTPCKPTSS